MRDMEKEWTDQLQNEEGLPGQKAGKHAYANKSVLENYHRKRGFNLRT